MFQINLIREKAIMPDFKKSIVGQFMAVALICLIGIVAVVAVAVSVHLKVSDLKRKKSEANRNIENVISTYNINNWGRKWATLYRNLETISNIYKNRVLWSVDMQALEKAIPENMGLDKLEHDKEEDVLRLNMIALAEGNEEFEQAKNFINNLEDRKVFLPGVALDTQNRRILNKKEVYLFKISIPLKEKGKNDG